MQYLEMAVFFLFAFVAVASALVMITRTKPIQSALAFLMTLISLAGLYLLLSAQFVAILQIVIYAGAILVLFLFVIMLLHSNSGEGAEEKIPFQRPVGILLSLGMLAGLSYVILAGQQNPKIGNGVPEDLGTAENIGWLLFNKFILPFEVASIILLAGLIGAVVLAKRNRGEAE